MKSSGRIAFLLLALSAVLGFTLMSHSKVAALAPSTYGLPAMTSIDQLPFLKVNEVTGHASSFDRTGGNKDFGNNLYTDSNGDYVLLDLKGPGTVYRMWTTQYNSSDILKVYFDGATTPQIDMTYGQFFSGSVSPFLSPLTGGPSASSGGSYNYVPLSFNKSIKITTSDANTYYNFDYHKYDPGTPITTWTGNEDESLATSEWQNSGTDPKSETGNTVISNTTSIGANASQTMADLAGPQQIKSVKVKIPGLYPHQIVNTPVTDDGRADKGSSQFTMAIDPTNQGVTLTRRLDYSIGDQKASVYVDGAYVNDWYTAGSASGGNNWLNSNFTIPSSFTAGKSSITIKVVFISSAVDWNEFTYWMYSSTTAGQNLTDTLDVGNATSESAHAYSIVDQTWTGTRTYTYPPVYNPTDDGRADKGSSQFTMAIDPNNQGVVLSRRFDYGIADQTANVAVDGVTVGTWSTTGSDMVNRWRTSSFDLPSSVTVGKSSITITISFVSSAVDWNEFTYWTFSKVNDVTTLSDTLDVGNTASESAHNYQITNQTWSGTESFTYPQPTDEANQLNALSLQAYWDGETTPSINAPLGALSGFGSFGATGSSQGLMFGMQDDGTIYIYYPMPFKSHATLKLVNTSSAAIPGVTYEVQYNTFTGSFQDVGYLKTSYTPLTASTSGKDIVFLDTDNTAGQVVGVVESMQGDTTRSYLEGDERAMIDDNRSPAINGTGTEDFYNGAWYFQNGPFSMPASGNTNHIVSGNYDETTAYRDFISDALPFRKHMRLTIQHGGTDNVSVNASTLAYYYALSAKLSLSDTLNIASKNSIRTHNYKVSGLLYTHSLTSVFEGENDTTSISATGKGLTGDSQFTMAIASNNQGVFLRRMFDQNVASQSAQVYVNGTLVGTWYYAGGNSTERWRESNFKIPYSFTAGLSSINVKIQYQPTASEWNEYQYSTYSVLP